MSFAFHYNSGQEAPFVLYIAHEDKNRGGTHWKPSALIGLTPALRSSDFLAIIAPDEFKSLLVLLTFLSPDGRCGASVGQLAQVLRLSHGKTRARFERLAAVRWQGQTIVLHTQWGDGLDGFAPAPGFIPVIEEPQKEAIVPPIAVLPRQAVIEHSRRIYARSRSEVERQIEEMMNWRKVPLPSITSLSSKEQKLKDELVTVGLLPEQAEELMRRFDSLRIRRQLAWLPLRAAKNKAGYLLAAIKDDYAAPRGQQPEEKGELGG
ncbi:hypothetical protein IAD21_06016 [Abditibacteriota bacterium]|nr:hypothetical protein IAD21_06016 [Abditibacteriota bacterium]